MTSASQISHTTSRVESATHGKTHFASFIALAALAVIALLALNNVSQPSSADRATLLFLALAGAICLLTPLRRHFESADAATFALAAAFFIVYTLARNAGPDEGWTLNFRLLPDLPIVVSWAARVAVGGALLSLIARPRFAGLTRALLAAMLLLAVVGAVMFNFLAYYYTVGTTGSAKVNPEFLILPMLQIVEFGAVALLCNAVAADPVTRRLAMRALPLVLFCLWARHQFGPEYVEPEETDG